MFAKKRYIDTRLKFAKNSFKKVVCDLNEKNLDGFNHCWHDLRKERRIISRRDGYQGNGSVMVWATLKKNLKMKWLL